MAKKGLVFITKSTFSGASAVNIDNCFSATYTHYLVKRNLLGSVGDATLGVRLRVSGSDSTTNVYRYQQLDANSTSVTGARITADSSWATGLGYTEATAFGYAELWISNPFEAVRTTAWCDLSNDADGSIYQRQVVMAHDNTTSYTGFTVTPGSGTLTGTISVFGLVKS